MAKEKRKNSPVTIAVAGGLFCGLAASVVVPRFTNALETSQELTALVIAIGFLIGASATYLAVRPKA